MASETDAEAKVGTPAGSPAPRSSYSARVERIFDHAPDTRSLFLHIEQPARFSFLPGQFISISIPLPDEVRTRPYTLASSPEDQGQLEICFNLVPGGRGVAWLFERRVKDTLNFTGPFGRFTLDHLAAQQETVFIAEGTAIAPIRPMLRRAFGEPNYPALHLLYAAADPQHLLYRNELEEFARRRPGLDLRMITEPRAHLYDRILEETEKRWVRADSNRARQFYVCGIGQGVIRLRDLLRAAGYERRAVHYERW